MNELYKWWDHHHHHHPWKLILHYLFHSLVLYESCMCRVWSSEITPFQSVAAFTSLQFHSITYHNDNTIFLTYFFFVSRLLKLTHRIALYSLCCSMRWPALSHKYYLYNAEKIYDGRTRRDFTSFLHLIQFVCHLFFIIENETETVFYLYFSTHFVIDERELCRCLISLTLRQVFDILFYIFIYFYVSRRLLVSVFISLSTRNCVFFAFFNFFFLLPNMWQYFSSCENN